MNKPEYDVVILGGGLAGLTLSLQIKQRNPAISILILEKRAEDAPTAAHKVGESTVELGTHYLRETLQLKDYLEAAHLPKHGLRFYFSPKHKSKIEERVELGPRKLLPIPSHQIDRGVFENELVNKTRALGNEVFLGADVARVELHASKDKHRVHFSINGKETSVDCRWAVDATGRNFLLKRQLALQKPIDHDVNAVWFRIQSEIDVTNWSDNKEWQDFLEPGLRRLGTIHFMDVGYWLWLIPLSSGSTSVGIVADAKIHPFSEINRLSKAMVWLKKNEPQAAGIIEPLLDKVLDFKALKHFPHHTERMYSADRWAVTGESGAFLDPLYSPGTDFIALNNTWLTDLILRDMRGENIELHATVYEKTHLATVDNWIPVYQNKYQLMGSTQIMVAKIFWDWATYWSITTLLFVNDGYTDIQVLKKLFGTNKKAGIKLGALNVKVQQLFLDWKEYDTASFSSRYIDPFDVDYLRTFHQQLDDKLNPEELLERVEGNLIILEKVAAELFRKVSNQVRQTPLNMEVDPYLMSLETDTRNNEGFVNIPVDQSISEALGVMWFYPQEVENE